MLVITVRLVSPLDGLAGVKEVSVELPVGATVAELVCSLDELLPSDFATTRKVLFMVNQKYAAPELVLGDGDQVLVLQVLGGG